MAAQVTDRAHRYRAQKLAPAGRKVCAYCGSTRNLVPDHIDGVPDHTTRSNLQWLCKSCNTAKGAAFAKAGKGRLTNQYNPAAGGVPTFEQYMWAVSNHTRGAHDEGGAVIHATPLHKRIEYARRIAPKAQATKQARFDERWNPSDAQMKAEGARFAKHYDIPVALGRKLWAEAGGNWAKAYELLSKHFKGNPWPFSRPDARRTTPASGGIAHHMAKAGKRPVVKSKAKAAKAGGARVPVPSDLQIEAGFKRGLSLREILGNPSNESVQDKSWRKWAENYQRVQRDPNAASAKDLRRALGYLDKARSSMIRRAHEKGAAPDPTVLSGFDNDYEYLKSLMLDKERGKRNPAAASAPFAVIASGKNSKWVEKRFKTEAAAERFAEAKNRVKRSKLDGRDIYPDAVYSVQRNPAAASASAFEEFHGFAPSEVVTVTKKIHHHKHLAAAGKLVQLDVWGIDDQGHKISGFKGAFLAFNESKNQLFVEGGDQSVNLADFGIDSAHELETLGRLTDIGYQTNKTHLGDEGGEAVYVHKFRTTNDGGRHVVVKIARYPDLIYDVRNEQLLFSGGSYEILREGINK